MDAALDAMKEYGFKEKDIKQAVKELLEVWCLPLHVF